MISNLKKSHLRPNKWLYLKYKLIFPFFLIACSVLLFLLAPKESLLDLITPYILLIPGLYWLGFYIFVCNKILYVIGSAALQIKGYSWFFTATTKTILYADMLEVCSTNEFFGLKPNIGTIKIYVGKMDEAGYKIYTNIIGVPEPQALVHYLRTQAGI